MLSELEKSLIAHFLFENGHANPRFEGDDVIYRDQTQGHFAKTKRVKADDILRHLLKCTNLPKVEKLVAYLRHNQKRYNVILGEYNDAFINP